MHPLYTQLIERTARRLLTVAQVCPGLIALEPRPVGEDVVLFRNLMQVTLRRTARVAPAVAGSVGREPAEYVAAVGRHLGDELAAYTVMFEALRRLDPVVPDAERLRLYFHTAHLGALTLLYGPCADAQHGGTDGLLQHLQSALRQVRPRGWSESVLPDFLPLRRLVREQVVAGMAHIDVVTEHRRTTALGEIATAAGRAARERAQFNRAERWFRRGISLSRAAGDRVACSRALGGLAKAWRACGELDRAERALARAISLARATQGAGARESLAFSYHEMVAVAIDRRDADAVEAWSRLALGAYPAEHEFRPVVAHDVALHWTDLGDYANAKRVLAQAAEQLPTWCGNALYPMRCYANLARAAGGDGDAATFAWAWERGLGEARRAPVCMDRATAYAQLAAGALTLNLLGQAREAVELARETMAHCRIPWSRWPRAAEFRGMVCTLEQRSLLRALPAPSPERDAFATYLVDTLRVAA